MALDPYWNNTVLLLHGDDAGDPGWPSIIIADNFTSNYAAAPYARSWKDGAPGVIGNYFGKQALYCHGTYPTMFNTGNSNATAFTIELDYYTTGFTQDTNCLFQNCNHQVSPYNTTPYLALWTNIGGGLGGNFHGTVVQGMATLAANTWYHISLSYNGATMAYVHVNGQLVRTVTSVQASASDIDFTLNYIGYGPNNNRVGLNNYFANLRVYRGAQLYGANPYTPTTRPLFGTVKDSSFATARYPVGIGSAATPYTADYKYGGGCMRFDGAGKLDLPASTDWNFGTGDFTVEAWVKPALIPGGGVTMDMLVFGSFNSTPDFIVSLDNASLVPVLWDGTTAYTGSSGPTVGNWTHVAWCRQNNTLRLFVGGTKVHESACAANFAASTTMAIGYENSSNTRFFNGLIDDLRVTKGVARYTADFTPPTQAFPDGQAGVSGVIRDAEGNLCSRRVFVHSRTTGRLLGTAVSDLTTGAYEIAAEEECYVVCLDSTDSLNAKIIDGVDPTV